MKFCVHLARSHPIVRRTCVLLVFRADVGALFDARDVVRIGAMQVTTGPFLLVEFDEDLLIEGALDEKLFFRFGAVAPKNFPGSAKFGGLADEFENVWISGVLLAKSVAHSFPFPGGKIRQRT